MLPPVPPPPVLAHDHPHYSLDAGAANKWAAETISHLFTKVCKAWEYHDGHKRDAIEAHEP
jgi:hypothetical protein